MLLSRGADVTATSASGDSAEDYARGSIDVANAIDVAFVPVTGKRHGNKWMKVNGGTPGRRPPNETLKGDDA